MIKFLITFATGFYCGLYLAQAHPDKAPVAPEPQELAIRVREWLDEATKPKRDQ